MTTPNNNVIDMVIETRSRLGLSRQAFADKYGITAVTLQQWEQGRRNPDRVSTLYLQMICKAPFVVEGLVREVGNGETPMLSDPAGE